MVIVHGLSSERPVFGLLADILDYPAEGLAENVRECEALLTDMDSEAVGPLSKFKAFVEATSLGRLQEIYTGAFDLDATCHPYVGYHLFGETYQRSAFLVGLKERYRGQGYVFSDTELPDRLSILLRFLSVNDDIPLTGEIISEAMIPALDKITKKTGEEADDESTDGRQPYQDALLTARIVLQHVQHATGIWTTNWMFLAVISLGCLVWMHMVIQRMMRSRMPATVRHVEERVGPELGTVGGAQE